MHSDWEFLHSIAMALTVSGSVAMVSFATIYTMLNLLILRHSFPLKLSCLTPFFSSRQKPMPTLAFTLMEWVLDIFLQISDCHLIKSRPPCVVIDCFTP